jgi:hypothetical protein
MRAGPRLTSTTSTSTTLKVGTSVLDLARRNRFVKINRLYSAKVVYPGNDGSEARSKRAVLLRWRPRTKQHVRDVSAVTLSWNSRHFLGANINPQWHFSFLYGGITSSPSTSTYNDMYVLSLPGFVFFKITAPAATRRADHTCVLVGKRQMLSIGGTDGSLGFPGSLTNKDPWKQGLGVFDLTSLQWTSRYDPDPPNYESPAMVKDWYAQGGLASVTWTNNEVKELFATCMFLS